MKAILVNSFLPTYINNNFSSQLLRDNVSSKQLQGEVFECMSMMVNSTNPDDEDDDPWPLYEDTWKIRGPYMTMCGRLINFKYIIRELKEENRMLKHKILQLQDKEIEEKDKEIEELRAQVAEAEAEAAEH